MSAIDAADRMTDLVDHYATLATLEAAAMGEHPAAAALVALVVQQRAALDDLEHEVAIYNRVLTASEIQAHYANAL